MEQVLSAMPFLYDFFFGHLPSIKRLLFGKVWGAHGRLSRILYRWCLNSALHQSECRQCTYLWILCTGMMILSLCVPIKQHYHDQLHFVSWFLPIFQGFQHHEWPQLVTYWPKWHMQFRSNGSNFLFSLLKTYWSRSFDGNILSASVAFCWKSYQVMKDGRTNSCQLPLTLSSTSKVIWKGSIFTVSPNLH